MRLAAPPGDWQPARAHPRRTGGRTSRSGRLRQAMPMPGGPPLPLPGRAGRRPLPRLQADGDWGTSLPSVEKLGESAARRAAIGRAARGLDGWRICKSGPGASSRPPAISPRSGNCARRSPPRVIGMSWAGAGTGGGGQPGGRAGRRQGHARPGLRRRCGGRRPDRAEQGRAMARTQTSKRQTPQRRCRRP